MVKVSTTASSLVLAALLALGVGLTVENWSSIRTATSVAPAATKTSTKALATAAPTWTASAPGRVEPNGGEVRITTQTTGRVVDVLVRTNDVVTRGDLLVQLADEEAQARLTAAEAEAAVRRRERDGETVGRPAQDRRNAEDAVAAAERALYATRMDLDRLLSQRRTQSGLDEEIAKARSAISAATDKLGQERANLRRVQATPGMPLPTRLESSLATARAEVSLAEAAVERARIRAPSNGSVLQVNARVGEVVGASPTEDALVLFGDTSKLRVRAEVEERDVTKIRTGQAAVVRSDAFPGMEFTGRIERMAQALIAPRLAARGPRRPTEGEVLEVLIDLDGRPQLLPGMRVDVFFKPDSTVGADPTANVKTN
jgi:HlyD family secretion protein